MSKSLQRVLIGSLISLSMIYSLVQSRYDYDTHFFSAATKAIFVEKDGSSISKTATILNPSASFVVHNLVDMKRKTRSVKEKGSSEEDDISDENKEESTTVFYDLVEDSSPLESTTSHYTSNQTDSTDTTDARAPVISSLVRNSVRLDFYLHIKEIADIDESTEIITMVITGRMRWLATDDLNPNHFYETKGYEGQFLAIPRYFNDIWKPDIIFRQNTKPSSKAFVHNPYHFVYYGDYGIQFYFFNDRRIKFKCDMDFTYYPADIHTCDFSVTTYNIDRLITMDWIGMRAFNLTDNNFEVKLQSHERKLELHPIKPEFPPGLYKDLQFTISLRRKIGYHAVQTYLPSILYILITCLCFLVPSHMVEVRIGISMTTLLTLTAMFGSVRESAPKVSYIKAIDIWMASCIFFVFLTLLEFTTLLWLRWQREADERKRLENQKMLNALKSVIGGKCVGGPVSGFLERSFSVESLQYSRPEKVSELVEKYGFIVFSLVFLSFNAVYWSWLIEASRYFKWEINDTIYETRIVNDHFD